MQRRLWEFRIGIMRARRGITEEPTLGQRVSGSQFGIWSLAGRLRLSQRLQSAMRREWFHPWRVKIRYFGPRPLVEDDMYPQVNGLPY
jgi:hypothetical protein